MNPGFTVVCELFLFVSFLFHHCPLPWLRAPGCHTFILGFPPPAPGCLAFCAVSIWPHHTHHGHCVFVQCCICCSRFHFMGKFFCFSWIVFFFVFLLFSFVAKLPLFSRHFLHFPTMYSTGDSQ